VEAPGVDHVAVTRDRVGEFSERAIRLYTEMRRCRDRDRWSAKLWEWPCVEDRHAGNSEKPGTYNYERWKPD